MYTSKLIGDYAIVGTNQDSSENTYKGLLNLSIDDENRIIAKWLINDNQEQFGSGFYKDNILVINFYYYDVDGNIYNGTVVYKCLSKDILEGFWTEEEGNPNYIGTENCFRIKEDVIN